MDDWNRLNRLPAKEIRELQNKKLRFFISRHIYPFSPHYRSLFIRNKIDPRRIKTVEDLRLIPFTSKEDFLPTRDLPGRFRDFILQPNADLIKKYWPKHKLLQMALLKLTRGGEYLKRKLEEEYRPIFLTATTGTTNNPVSFLYTAYDMQNLRLSGYRLLEVFGGGSEIRGVNLFPYAPHLAFWQTVSAGLEHKTFLLSTGGGKVMGTQGNIETILKIKPHIIIGVPSYIYHVVRTAKEAGKDFSFIQKVVLGASMVPLGFKEKLAKILKSMGSRHVRIFGTYGFTEARCAWGECPTPLKISSGYHTYPDKEIFEIIDPETGEVKKEGEDGELVYTGLDARGSCVLRYRTGDLVKGGITYTRCPYCKRTVPRISSAITRVSNIKNLKLSKVKGTLVNLDAFAQILDGANDIGEWQVEIRKKDNDPYEVDELVIYISVPKGVSAAGLKERLRDRILSSTEITPNEIIILPYEEMLERIEIEVSHKTKRIVDKRPKG